MPRENSLTDSEGRSLTPEPEREVLSPTYSSRVSSPQQPFALFRTTSNTSSTRLQSPIVRTQPWSNLTPKEKFRASVNKVITMHRSMTMFTTTGTRLHVGAEPGIDPRHISAEVTYGNMICPCRIEIVDYSAIRNTHRVMGNDEFVEFMDNNSKAPPSKPPWAKVRWINIGGLSWDVIKALSIKYDLHPLALEDVFHGHSRNRSKADYYTQHLFLRVLCHQLVNSQQENDSSGTYTTQARSTSPEPMSEVEEERLKDNLSGGLSSPNGLFKRRIHPLLPLSQADTDPIDIPAVPQGTLWRLLKKKGDMQAARIEQKKNEVSLDALKQGERVNVKVFPTFIFLFRDGTVISLQSSGDLDLTYPISQRLRSRDTVLSKSADPSLLVHALLDLIVDKALQVIDQYHVQITKFEHDTLLKPEMQTVRKLHILSGDLILHKRTLEPIKTLVYALRRYDLDRSEALIDFSDPANKDVKAVGFMSHNSKIYLADVFDHMEYILTSLDMFSGIAENLINYSFNLASNQMNDVMRRLTIATIVCLPLTILTGYFGMNFEKFWSVHNNSDLFFWKLAIPILAIVTPLALLSDLKNLWLYLQHLGQSKKAILSYKRA